MNSLMIIFFLAYGLYAFFYNFKFWCIYMAFIVLYYYFTQQTFYHSLRCNIGKKINYTAWSTPYDPQIYTTIKLDITKIIPYLEKKSEELKDLNEHYKVTTFVIKLLSIVLKKYPAVYGYIKFGRYEPKEGVDICCLVNVGEGKELANTTIKNCENKTMREIHIELKNNATTLKQPTFLLGPLTQIFSYISSIGIQFKPIGLRQFEFGSCVITNIGSIGIENSLVPIPPVSFAPAILTLCSYYKRNVKNEDEKIEEKIYLKMNFTTDYRFLDYNMALKLFNDINKYGSDPDVFEKECLKYEKKDEHLKKVE